jgi:hypothetical protein
MKTIILIFVALPFLLVACATNSQVERTTNLGFGFRRVVVSEPSHSSFESIGHFEYLYFRDHRLCHLGQYSISPSGKFAVYHDGPSGCLFLFCSADGKQTQLTSQFVALVDRFEWHEDINAMEARFASGHGVQRFVLQ